MDISGFIIQHPEVIVEILFGIYPIIIKFNLHNFSIPNTFEEFNNEYGEKLDKILNNNLFNSSTYLEEIFKHSSKNTEEESLKLIKAHDLFFKSIKKNIFYSKYKNEINEDYNCLINFQNKINNLIGVIYVLISIMLCLTIGGVNGFPVFICWIIVICISIETYKSWLIFKDILFKINIKKEKILEIYEDIPKGFGD